MYSSFKPGNMNCNAQVNDLSQCTITQNNGCSQYSYITCKNSYSFFCTFEDILGHINIMIKKIVELNDFKQKHVTFSFKNDYLYHHDLSLPS